MDTKKGDPEMPDRVGSEQTPLVAKNRFVGTSLLCRPCAWVMLLSENFTGSLLLMLFATQHLLKGLVAGLVFSTSFFLLAMYGISGTQMQVYAGVIMLPWAMKPIIGLVSDCCPIWGLNKTPYMVISCVVGVVALAAIGFHPSWLNAQGAVLAIFFVMLMLSTCDLLTEAKYAKMMKQVPHLGPDLMSYVWFGLQAGGFAAVLMVGPLMDYWSIYSPCIVAIFPVIFTIGLLFGGYMMEEAVTDEQLAESRARLWAQAEACFLCLLMLVGTLTLTVLGVVFKNVTLNVVAAIIVAVVLIGAFGVLLRPIIAKVNTFFVIQTTLSLSYGGGSFYFFTDNATQYPEGPHFSILFYTTVLGVVSSVFSLIGIFTYQQYWKNWKYRSLIVFTNVTVAVLSFCDCIIYSRLNVKLGIPDQVFVLGTSALQTVIGQWMWVPGIVILSQLCPKDMEATMYALLAGCHNLGGTVASSCGAMMLQLMGVQPSGAEDESAEFKNLWKCSAIATVFPLITLVLLPFLIPDAAQTDTLMDEDDRSATEGSIWRRFRGKEG